MEQTVTQPKTKKSKATAIASFILSLTFWIPLLNLIFGMLAIYLGIKSLTKIKKYPDKYGGKAFAVIGAVLGAVVYITYLTGLVMCLSGYKEICKFMGLQFLT